MKNQAGTTLTEAMAALVILSIAAVMACKGFQIAGNLLIKSSSIRHQTEDAANAIEFGESADSEEICEIELLWEGHRLLRFPVKEKRYGIDQGLLTIEKDTESILP